MPPCLLPRTPPDGVMEKQPPPVVQRSVTLLGRPEVYSVFPCPPDLPPSSTCPAFTVWSPTGLRSRVTEVGLGRSPRWRVLFTLVSFSLQGGASLVFPFCMA